jgi:hypothetical protein
MIKKKQIVIKRIRTKSVIKIKWKWIPRGGIENKKKHINQGKWFKTKQIAI